MKFIHILAVSAIVAASGAQAQTAPASGADHSAHHPTATAAAPQSDGEVRKVDKEQGKVTLRHGPLQNLDMPAMTMVFKVADPKMLESIKEGDKVKFTAEKANGAITITAMQVAN
jgi:Cu(I)/Ag(I) efflux system periplasmic protein CusF